MRWGLFIVANIVIASAVSLAAWRSWDLKGIEQAARAAVNRVGQTGNLHRGSNGARAVGRLGSGRRHK